MNLSSNDVEWLDIHFPSLICEPESRRISGELSFCSCYDHATGMIRTELLERDDAVRSADNFICDVFEIDVQLVSILVSPNGWPLVYEIGGRGKAIADKCGIGMDDLHFNSSDGLCCLGVRHALDRTLTLQSFFLGQVIPFFYRLSYADRYGMEAVRRDLWGEYSHGNEGLKEHLEAMVEFQRRNLGEAAPCPCGSGVDYGNCHLEEVVMTIRRGSK